MENEGGMRSYNMTIRYLGRLSRNCGLDCQSICLQLARKALALASNWPHHLPSDGARSAGKEEDKEMEENWALLNGGDKWGEKRAHFMNLCCLKGPF